MARYKVILIYDGTAFSGMQRQANARTVQGEVEEALVKIGWQGTSILAAGRTDAGVHASGQVIAFDLDWQHDEQALQNATSHRGGHLNLVIPNTIGRASFLSSKSEITPEILRSALNKLNDFERSRENA